MMTSHTGMYGEPISPTGLSHSIFGHVPIVYLNPTGVTTLKVWTRFISVLYTGNRHFKIKKVRIDNA